MQTPVLTHLIASASSARMPMPISVGVKARLGVRWSSASPDVDVRGTDEDRTLATGCMCG